MRYFVEFAYLGKAYHGWQKQPNAISVQEVFENALNVLLKAQIEVVAAGRTDAGVHAKQMFAHFDVSEEIKMQNLVFRMNSLLPKDIAVKDFYKVKNEAHARFDALSRTYEYHLVQEKNPFEVESAYFLRKRMDIDLMNEAANELLKHTDFKCFSKSRTDVYTYNCKIEYAFWKKENEKLIFNIKADRFLRNMVRAIVGTLIDIGTGKENLQNLKNIIESRDRSRAGTSVPAHGLYLTQVEYPENIKIN